MTDQLDLTGPSPLLEADPLSLDELFARVNQGLAAGLPEEIDDSALEGVIARLRAQREKYVLEGEQPKPAKRAAGKRGSKPVTSIAQALDDSELDEL
jgi:hypothetical protein